MTSTCSPSERKKREEKSCCVVNLWANILFGCFVPVTLFAALIIRVFFSWGVCEGRIDTRGKKYGDRLGRHRDMVLLSIETNGAKIS